LREQQGFFGTVVDDWRLWDRCSEQCSGCRNRRDLVEFREIPNVFSKLILRFGMKAKIHPEYVECTVSCACGNKFVTRSTKKAIALEICSACHPFFTGRMKFVDTTGRVERFQKKYKWDQRKKAAEEAPK
jgi:large subunit ribosomal protein L31